MKKAPLYLVAALSFLVQQSTAQTQDISAVKILAQIDDKIILYSDFEEYKNSDLDYSPLPECFWLEGQILEKSLIILANRESILNDSELNAQLTNQIKCFISQYGSQKELEKVAGKSVKQIKDDMRPAFKERMWADKMRHKILDTVTVTVGEVKAFFDKTPLDSLPYLEGKMEIKQIIIYPKADKNTERHLYDQLLDWKHLIETGQKKLRDIAHQYSQDPGSKEQGGEYAISKNDKQWDSSWFAAIWKLKKGQVSPVVKSKFGLHIMQLVSRTGNDAVIRHILLIPPITLDEINKTKTIVDSIRIKIMSGKTTFDYAIDRYNEDDLSKTNGGAVLGTYTGSNFVTIDELDKNMVVAIKGMKTGDICPPQIYKDDRQRNAVRIILLKSKMEDHIENLKDDYHEIAQKALEAKKKIMLSKWIRDHILGYYLNIDKSFNACVNLAPWIEAFGR